MANTKIETVQIITIELNNDEYLLLMAALNSFANGQMEGEHEIFDSGDVAKICNLIGEIE